MGVDTTTGGLLTLKRGFVDATNGGSYYDRGVVDTKPGNCTHHKRGLHYDRGLML